MTDRDYERWTELQDREATGTALSAAEREFCARMAATHPLCAREDEMLNELAQLECEPDAGAREREEAVLAAIWNEAATSTTTNTATTQAETAAPSSVPSVITLRARTYSKLGGTLVAAAAVALLVGNGIGSWQRSRATDLEPQASRVELVYTSGDVRIDAHPAAFGQLLAEGSVVQVNDGTACLAIDPGIDVCVGKQSKLRVGRTAAVDGHVERRVDLLAGDVTAAIDPQPQGTRFSVVADKVWSTAVGTAYSVSLGKDGSVQTAVLSGKVLVGVEGKQQPVTAHQRAHLKHGTTHGSASVVTMARAEEAPYWAAIKTIELWRDPKTATLIVNDGHHRASLWLDGQEIGVSPLSSLIPAGEHRLTSLLADGRALEHTFMIAAGKTWSLDLNAEVAQLRAADGLSARVTDATDLMAKRTAETLPAVTIAPASELLARARQQLRQSRWQDAAATYRELRRLHGESAEAKTVLVSLAQLSIERLGQPAVALADLDIYLSEGGGALTQEARYLRIQALRAVGRESVARDAANAFLDDYPTSFQAEALRGDLSTQVTPMATPSRPE